MLRKQKKYSERMSAEGFANRDVNLGHKANSVMTVIEGWRAIESSVRSREKVTILE